MDGIRHAGAAGGGAVAAGERHGRRYALLAGVLVAALAAVRLWLCGRFELAGDEAYFWIWSRQLAWGYFSKGPGIAVLVRLGTALAGDSELGVRLAAVLASAGASLGIHALGRDLYSPRVGFWAVVVANTTPLFYVGSLLATADMPSICIWTWGAVWFWRLQKREQGEVAGAGAAPGTVGRQGGGWRWWAPWPGLGLLLGCGTLVPIEAAAHGVPLLAGPHCAHIAELADTLEAAGGLLRLHAPRDLVPAWRALLADPPRRRRMGEAARAAVAGRGARIAPAAAAACAVRDLISRAAARPVVSPESRRT